MTFQKWFCSCRECYVSSICPLCHARLQKHSAAARNWNHASSFLVRMIFGGHSGCWQLVGLGSSCSQSRRHRRANLDRGEAIIVDSRLRWIMLMLSEHPWLFYLANRIWSFCTAIIIKLHLSNYHTRPGKRRRCSSSHDSLRGIHPSIHSIHSPIHSVANS